MGAAGVPVYAEVGHPRHGWVTCTSTMRIHLIISEGRKEGRVFIVAGCHGKKLYYAKLLSPYFNISPSAGNLFKDMYITITVRTPRALPDQSLRSQWTALGLIGELKMGSVLVHIDAELGHSRD